MADCLPAEVFLPVGLNKVTWVSTRLIVTSAEIYGADGNQKAGEVRNIGRIALGGGEEAPRVRLLVSSSLPVCVSFFVYDRSSIQRTADNESGDMQSKYVRSSSPPEAAEPVDPVTKNKAKGQMQDYWLSKLQVRKLVPGLALFSASLLRGRQRDTDLLASDMVMKTAK